MKKIIATIIVFVMLLALVGCGNKTLFDTQYTFEYAIVAFPDGSTKNIEIKQWKDYEDGEQIQIIAKDGTVYLVNSVNCVLVKED